MTKFEGHYTGIETAKINLPNGDLYVQRAKQDKKLQFIRLYIGRRMLGAHIGKTNYFRGKGIEFFTNKLHFGFSSKGYNWSDYKNRKHGILEVRYSGSTAEPFTTVVLRVGFICFGIQTPKWLKKRKEDELWGTDEDCKHEWEDDSFGGPDSGYMGVVCKKCGKSEGEWLY